MMLAEADLGEIEEIEAEYISPDPSATEVDNSIDIDQPRRIFKIRDTKTQ